MKQMTFSALGFDRYAKTTRREIFLQGMDKAVPWARLTELIEPHYYAAPAPDQAGRRPVGLERMLRMYFLQQWFNLSDPAAEEALYDSISMRSFVGIDLGREAAPDETTLCKFRHLMERHDLGKRISEEVHVHLESRGVRVFTGTIVDATIIAAPPSTKNKDKARDRDMHQTKKGNQWHFGMKAHIGVDSKTKVIHAVVATAVNVCMTQPLLAIFCTARKPASGATVPIRGRRKRSAHVHQTQRILPTGATASRMVSTKWKRRRTPQNPGFARRSSTSA